MKKISAKSLRYFALVAAGIFCSPLAAEVSVTIVSGLPGEQRFEESFHLQHEKIKQAAAATTSAENIHSFSGDEATRENLLRHFSNLSEAMTEEDRSQLFLIGHGSFDGEEYKFNIPGPDLTGQDINELISQLPGENHLLINTSSASGALLQVIESDKIIIVTATRNGNEKNAPEFGVFFTEALAASTADTNKNTTISLQEAFDFANREVEEFYGSAGRLATEHPQLKGNNADRLIIARLNSNAPVNDNPALLSLLEQQAEIDGRIEDLQLSRQEYSNEDYISRLQSLILEAAMITEEIEKLESLDADAPVN